MIRLPKTFKKNQHATLIFAYILFYDYQKSDVKECRQSKWYSTAEYFDKTGKCAEAVKNQVTGKALLQYEIKKTK